MRASAKLLSIIIVFISTFHIQAQEADTTKNGITKDDVLLVLKMFDGQPISTIIEKAEYFIETGKDAAQKAFFAAAAIDYYRESRIMGYDEAAIYITDHYFQNGNYKYPYPDKWQAVKLFADCNRNSLIDLNAPDLTLPDAKGTLTSLKESPGAYKILYFYDDECASCKRQLPALMEYLQGISGFKVTFYRVYTQDNRERWERYLKETSSKYPLPATIHVVDVWDPELTSDFPRLYGVISTPQLLVLDKNNKIIGRKLTPKALSQVIEIDRSQPNNLEMLFDTIFQPIVANTSVDMDTTKITDAVDMFYEDSKDNPDLFHESMYTLFQYLKNQSDYDLQRGAAYLANKYIVNMPQMWELISFTPDEETKGSMIHGDYTSVKAFLNETSLAVNLFYLNQLGKPATDLTLYTPDKKPFTIHSVKADFTILYFYSINCATCDAATEDMKKMFSEYKDKNVKFLGIYTGKDKKWKKYLSGNSIEWISLWDKDGKSGMFSKYDLSGMPRIYLLDKDKKTLGKDINPKVLEDVLKYLFPKDIVAEPAL